MKTLLTLENARYTMEFSHNGSVTATAEGTYCNFVEKIATLDDWFTSLRKHSELVITDNRTDTSVDSITHAKAVRAQELVERAEILATPFATARALLDALAHLDTPKIALIREVRDRFSTTIAEARDLVEA